MDPNLDWKSLAEDWQHQPVPGLDMAALRHEVNRRGRALRWVLAGEIALTVVVVLACGLILLDPGAGRLEQLLFSAMALFLVGYQAFMIRLRMRDLEAPGLDAPALVELEMRRCRTTLGYWRIGMWTAVGLWTVLYAVMLAGAMQDWPLRLVAGLAGGLGINVLLFPLMGLYGVWSCRRARGRLHRYQALREQLRAP